MVKYQISIKISLFIFVFAWILAPNNGFSRSVTMEFAQSVSDEKNQQINYTDARLLLESMEISSEKMQYNQSKHLFSFEGNLFIDNQKALILAKSGTYDIKSGVLLLFDVSFFDQIRKTYINAEKIERISESKFIIYNGTFTSCNPKTPAWEISSSYVMYEFENYASSTNTFINLYSIPIFYAPYLSWPTTSKRGSGFLFPEYNRVISSNRSKSYGNRLTIPYFLVLDKDHDLTIGIDIIEKRGVGLDLEYQYAFQKGMQGRVIGWYLNESQNRNLEEENLGNKDANSVDKSPERHRYIIDHKQDIFWNGQFFFHQEDNSDNEINREYFNAQVEKDAFYSRSFDVVFKWDSGSISTRYDEGEDFLYESVFDTATNKETKIHKQPSISFNQSFSRILDSNLTIGFNDTWTDYKTQYGWDGIINQSEINVKYPFNIDFLNIIPEYRKNLYQFDVEYTADPSTSNVSQDPDPYEWTINTYKLEANFELFRYYQNLKNENTGKLVIIPKITFNNVENVNQERIKIIDEIQGQDNIVYDLSIFYLTKDLSTKSINKIFQLDFSQVYNYYETENGKEEVRPLEITFSLFPDAQFTSKLFYRYDNDNDQNKITETKAAIQSKSVFGDSISLQYTNNTESYTKLDGTSVPIAKVYTIDGLFNITSIIKLDISGDWDLNRHDAAYRHNTSSTMRLDRALVSAKLALTYQHDCYLIRLQYNEDIKEEEINGQTSEYLDKRISLNFSINEWDISNIYGVKYADNQLSKY